MPKISMPVKGKICKKVGGGIFQRRVYIKRAGSVPEMDLPSSWSTSQPCSVTQQRPEKANPSFQPYLMDYMSKTSSVLLS